MGGMTCYGNVESITEINIEAEYFGINKGNNIYKSNMSYFFKREEISAIDKYNDIVTKKEAIDIAKNLFKNYTLDFCNFYISYESMKINDVKDTFNNKIFSNEYNFNGWLIFVDPINVANWSHYCEYWFIISKDVRCFVEGKWKPNNNILMGKFRV
ncbi:MAG: hypothetical protein K0R54_5728 [Clostridiaceae bacterium]|jgi:hypothetical protein|nr:hypothetical protein [Clostridiaceae bacterium]